MNILFVHFHEEVGGGEKYFINIINKLPKHYNIFLLTPNHKATISGLIKRKISKISKKFIINIGPLPIFSYALFYKIFKQIKKNSIEIIHFSDHNMIPTMILLKLFSNTKIVFTSHGRWDVHFFFNKILLKILNPATIVSTDIHYFRMIEIIKHINLIPIIVQEPDNINKHDINKDKIKLGLIGRFSTVKNHKLAFEILSKLNSDIYELHIYGDKTLNIKEENTNHQQGIYKLINQHTNAIHHGILHDQDKMYNNIDILLQTSISEASSLVTIEAQKYGIPLICSLTEASSYTVLNGCNGFICFSINDYINKINIIKKNYTEFSENAHKNSKNFDENTYISKLISLYKQNTANL